MTIYKLGLNVVLYRKLWIVAILVMIGGPIVLPLLSPVEFHRGLLEPARAQAAWGLAWGVSLLWVFYQSAAIGDHFRKSGLCEYFSSKGFSPSRQIAELSLVVMTFLVPIAITAMLVTLLFAMPSDATEAAHWVKTTIQAGLLFLLVTIPLSVLALSLANRFGCTVGYLVTLSLAIYGLYGVGYLDQLFKENSVPLIEWMWLASPHYHLADLTPRFIFKAGSLETESFFQMIFYFGSLSGIILLMSRMSYSIKSAR